MMSIATNIYADDTFEVNGALYSVSSSSTLALVGFANKENVRNYKIPETITYNTRTMTVTEISQNAFEDCVNLESLTIPGSINRIAYHRDAGLKGYVTRTFANCVKLKKLIFEDSSESLFLPDYEWVKSYHTYERRSLFYDSKVEYLYLGRNVRYDYRSSNPTHPFQKQYISTVEIGSLVTEIPDYFLYCNEIFKSISFPPKMTKIGKNAFYGCYNLEKIVFKGNAVTTIDDNAFFSCNLKKLELPESLEAIGNSAFVGCDNIANIIIPDNVTSIGLKAFYGCDNLQNITIGKNVSLIDPEAFQSCPNIKTIISRIDDPSKCKIYSYYNDPFGSSTYANAILYVPIGSIEKYRKHYTWGKFFNIQESAKATNISINDKGQDNIVLEGDQLKFEGFIPLDIIMLYDADGRLKYESKISTEGTLSVPLYNYPKGIYFVKTKGNVYKFVK